MEVAMKVMLVLQLLTANAADTVDVADTRSENDVYESAVQINEDAWECRSNVTDCSLPTVVNYRMPKTEFAISFDCNVASVANEHSRTVFRKVSSYLVDGREVCCGVGVGLQYLHFHQNIKLLVLVGYCLRTLPSNTFEHFSNLDRLEVSASRIQHIEHESFQELQSLRELLLESNEFGTIERDAIDVLVQLQQLRIRNCTGIDFSIRSLKKLQVLELMESMVKNITSIFDSVPSVLRTIHSLGVMSEKTSSISVGPAVDNDSDVQEIMVVECFLTSAIVRNLPSLATLNLSRNLLDEKSIKLINLPALEQLILSHNFLELVSASLFGVGTSLTMIDISYNVLSYIHPDAFGMAPSVRTLDLSYNALLSLGNFVPWFNLVRIRVDGNPWDCLWLQHSRRMNPTLFETFYYNKRFDVLTILGLPCALEISTKSVSNIPSFKTTIKLSLPTRGTRQGKIINHGPKISIKVPLNVVGRRLVVIVTVAVGILISHVIILLYNRYRKSSHVPFYRHLSKDQSCVDTITEKSTSFMYEAPLNSDRDALTLNNIYEEIRETKPFESTTYDVLNFHLIELQQIDERTASNDAVYV